MMQIKLVNNDNNIVTNNKEVLKKPIHHIFSHDSKNM